jgi:hypothetical protein
MEAIADLLNRLFIYRVGILIGQGLSEHIEQFMKAWAGPYAIALDMTAKETNRLLVPKLVSSEFRKRVQPNPRFILIRGQDPTLWYKEIYPETLMAGDIPLPTEILKQEEIYFLPDEGYGGLKWLFMHSCRLPLELIDEFGLRIPLSSPPTAPEATE